MLTDNNVYYTVNPKDWWFTHPKTRHVFQLFEKHIEAREKVTIAVIGSEFDPGYVAELTSIPTGNAAFYAEKALKGGRMELIRRLGVKLQNEAETGNFEAIVDELEKEIERVVLSDSDYTLVESNQATRDVIDVIERRYLNKGQLPGLPSGLDKLDDMLMGFQPTMFYVIGARPSQGKSSLLITLCARLSELYNTCVITAESSRTEFFTRMIANESGINSQRLNSGFISADDFASLTDAAEIVAGRKVQIFDKPNCTLRELVSIARRAKSRGAEVLLIDYIQIIKASGDSRREQVSTVSMRLKDLARELNVPIIAAAQLKRDSDGRRPTLGDFQHSSQMEQDADGAILLYHFVIDEAGNKIERPKDENPGEKVISYLLVEKARDGRTGAIPVSWQRDVHRWKESRD
jgi:replicative DNA helicase